MYTPPKVYKNTYDLIQHINKIITCHFVQLLASVWEARETRSVRFLALLAVTGGQEVLAIDYLYYTARPSVRFPRIDTNMHGMHERSQISQAP